MKTLTINFVAIVAVLIGLMAMSFQSNIEVQGYEWYEVDTDGITIVSDNPIPGGEPEEPDCNADNSATLCAIEILLDTEEDFPQTVAEAKTNHQTRGETKRDE